MNSGPYRPFRDRPALAIVTVLVLDMVVVYGVALLADVLSFGDCSGFLLRFVTRAMTWLFLLPLVLRLPNGKAGVIENVQNLGLLRTTPARRTVLLSLIGMSVTCLSLWLPSLVFSRWYANRSTLWPHVLTAINPAVWEEFVYRGVVLTLLLKRLSDSRAILLGSLVFSLVHLQNLLFGQPLMVMAGQLVFAFTGGLFLSSLYVRSASLIPGIMTHYVGDALYVFLTFSLIQPGPDMIRGGLLMLASSSVTSVLAAVLILRCVPGLGELGTDQAVASRGGSLSES